MTLHPIRVLDHVTDEYRDYLLTEFRAKDPVLRAALERELDRSGFLAQEPFFQAHRPFRSGGRWRDLPLDARLAGVMERRSGDVSAYIHQSDAISDLLSPSAHPVVVTTGTGSGKTEAFLLPVIQNAFEDSVRFNRSGLTAILIYPMNALANDQRQRIDQYLVESGMAGAVRVEQYDRSTNQAKRQEMRANPPHILLTNYMMLEYLLVRPADRNDIFANHRCRFVVLDEVHTYRGILGSNIALLVRRLRVHLSQAQHNWRMEVSGDERRFRYPQLVPIGTSATIRSISEEGRSREEVTTLRDEAVQGFFASLTGAEPASIRVFGEQLRELDVPPEATYPAHPDLRGHESLDVSDVEEVRLAICSLAGLPPSTSLNDAARRCRLLWDLNRWLIRRPMSISQMVERVQSEVTERATASVEDVSREIEAALTLGAALPDGTPGALRLRTHRFIRGGWKFYRCVNPACGRLYPMGEERCGSCQHVTAPLYLCRNCGADYLRFAGDIDNEPLHPSAIEGNGLEWLTYEASRFDIPIQSDDDDEDDAPPPPPRSSQVVPAQIGGRPVLDGSLDPASLQFSRNVTDYQIPITLVPRRIRCLCCGGSAGSRNVITPVALGTSAAVKVLGEGLVEALAEANRDRAGHDGKERLLIFADSRQDAAHQARFIIFASRYDRMRQRVVQILSSESSLTFQRVVELLAESAVRHRDNPYVPDEVDWIPDEVRSRIQTWEEAPLLDEISVNAGYRATLVNLGLVGLRYHRLDEYLRVRGNSLSQSLGISIDDLEHVCRVLLDEIRTRGAFSRPLLRYHPNYVACPAHFAAAEWERSLKQPQGYPSTPGGEVATYLDPSQVPSGIKRHNAWKRQGVGGRGPSIERILRHLLDRLGGTAPDELAMASVLDLLLRGSFLVSAELFGLRERRRLLQVNAEIARMEYLTCESRRHCSVCGDARPFARTGAPCSRCHGSYVRWPDEDVDANRTVRRIRQPHMIALVAGEHTAQVTSQARAELEDKFKAGPEVSPTNVLACSPTLEMGIDVGGLDAVVLRNVPPRPDNYAQRGGRAGRRSRVGLVIGYARSTPHDQYFYDNPAEMIAGEVPAPAVSLGNRDVIVRHLHAILFGATEPGLSGRMVEYVGPDGQPREEAIAEFITAVQQQIDHTVDLAQQAWGEDILCPAGISEEVIRGYLSGISERIRYVFNCTARQVFELRQALDRYAISLEGQRAGNRAALMVARLLGMPVEANRNRQDADDHSAGYPLRRFAEFGLLPGYEFPSQPSSLRLLGDDCEEDPVSVTRRFGIGQFQPGAHVYARKRRWKVIGLDTSSPWNPHTETPTWSYRLCGTCELRYDANEPSCPRCNTASPGRALPGYDFAGFLARKEERPILDEEERFAVRNLVRMYPQWNGDTVGRWTLANGWALRLSRNEEVRWVNEGPVPTPADLQNGAIVLHPANKGFLLCPSCGSVLQPPPPTQTPTRGRRNAQRGVAVQNNNGHADSCHLRGATPSPLAIATSGHGEVLRLLVPVPLLSTPNEWQSWGLSLGYALLNGLQQFFVLDAAEMDFELEGPWNTGTATARHATLSLAFIDPSLGGSGYLPRVAENFHRVAERAIAHLSHANCESACYRCLKTYQNQRFHEFLAWPQTIAPLEDIAHDAPQTRALETGDIADPRPWLEAYAAGVGSPLELRFLRLFERHGFHPQKQVPVSPNAGPPISVADFAVQARRLAIYIDGAAFHVGNNLRRDRFIRSSLRNGSPPWRVEELRASDLSQGQSLVERLLHDD